MLSDFKKEVMRVTAAKSVVFRSAIGFFLLSTFAACDKDFLDKRQNSSIIIPSTLDDFQKLLDAEFIHRQTPAIGEISSDDYYIQSDVWKGITDLIEKNAYSWSSVIYDGLAPVEDWNIPYQQVFYANVVLDGLQIVEVSDENTDRWKVTKGSALFIRANAFFNLAQIFSPAFDEGAASNKYGIPLRLNANVDERTQRSTVQGTYDRIIFDLLEAKDLLPLEVPVANRNRASRPAAFALLARVFLSMREYEKAGKYADSSLQLYNKLIDFNTVSLSATFPFTRLNDETLYQSNILTGSTILQALRTSSGYYVDSNLYKSYTQNDLRKSIFYSNTMKLKGSYAERQRFSGLATDEMLLIRAECTARAGDAANAMEDLNYLLKTRWRKTNGQSTFIDYSAIDSEDALRQILKERRKELVLRGVRWSDLRRLNKDGGNITISRLLDGVSYILPPNDPRYVAPIPNDVISLTGIEQNPR